MFWGEIMKLKLHKAVDKPILTDQAISRNLKLEDCDQCSWCGCYYDPENEGFYHDPDLLNERMESENPHVNSIRDCLANLNGRSFCCQECEAKYIGRYL
jgi:hypothetical protein